MRPINAWALLQMLAKEFNCVPLNSSSEMKRALQNKAVIINGKKPGPLEEIKFPVTELVFFPKSVNKVTLR